METEVAEAFPTSELINRALRRLMPVKPMSKLTTREFQEQLNAFYQPTLEEIKEERLYWQEEYRAWKEAKAAREEAGNSERKPE